MLPADFWETQTVRPRKTLNRAIELAEQAFPELELSIARDGADIIQLFLFDGVGFRCSDSMIASYNKWYDEITFYKLTFDEGR